MTENMSPLCKIINNTSLPLKTNSKIQYQSQKQTKVSISTPHNQLHSHNYLKSITVISYIILFYVCNVRSVTPITLTH